MALFVPQGVPKALLPMIVAIEIMSFISRPISHSVRLFANMLGGHITIKVFAGFAAGLMTYGALGAVGVVVPVVVDVALYALELLGRLPAGLRFRGPDLHLPERRASSLALNSRHPATAGRTTQGKTWNDTNTTQGV